MRKVIALLLIAAILLFTAVSLAQSTGLGIGWWTVDGGGAKSTGGSYTIVGTAGQPDASLDMRHNTTSVLGGFWNSSIGQSDHAVYLPVVVRP